MSDFDFTNPQRGATFRFEVLDLSLGIKGLVELDQEASPSIDNNTTSPIKRAMRGFRAAPDQADKFDPITDRVRPVMMINGIDYPMGVFLFNDGSRMPHTYGQDFAGSLVDQGLMIADELPTAFGLGEGADIKTAIAALLEGGGIAPTRYNIDAVSGNVGAPGWVKPSGTIRGTAIDELCAKVGCFPVYFDNLGIAQVRTIDLDLTMIDPTVIYDYGVNIDEGSIVDTDTTITAYNRFVVTDTGAKGAPISGIYDVPATAPQAFENIGYYRTKNITEQGIPNSDAAVVRAHAAALVSLQDARWVTFTAPIDPRHDTFDVVSFIDVPFRETGWSTSLTADAGMTHQLRQVWSQ